MPLSPTVADPYTTQPDGDPQDGSASAVYAALVVTLLGMLAAYLAPKPGIPIPEWARGRSHALPRFRTLVLAELGRAQQRAERVLARDIGAAWAAGAAEAARDARWRGPVPPVPEHRVAEAVQALTATHARAAIVIESAYRKAVAAAQAAQARAVVASAPIGAGVPEMAVQQVLDQLADRGIAGYVDRAGRQWSLETYVETAVRWRIADAALAAYVQVAQRAGVRFLQVSVNLSAHAACRAWEGSYVSIDGTPAGTYQVATAAGRTIAVTVKGTLEESRAAGLWHPHCAHRLTALVPGAGIRARRAPGGREDRVARAQRRYWARTARAWERRRQVALTPAARQQVNQRIRHWRGSSGRT